MAIGDNIKKYRTLNNLSQEQLANQLYVSRQTISQWEKGQTQPTVDNIIRLKEIFKITADEIIDDTLNSEPDTETEKYSFKYSDTDFSQIKKILFFKQIRIHLILFGLCILYLLSNLSNPEAVSQTYIWIGIFISVLFSFILSLRSFSSRMEIMKKNMCTATCEYELTESTIKITANNPDKYITTHKFSYDDIKKISCSNGLYFLYTTDKIFIINRSILNDNSFLNLYYYKQKSKYSEINSKDKVISTVLFILSLAALVGSLFVLSVLDSRNNASVNNMLVFFLFTPISVADYLYGVRLKKRGFKYKKNVISGFIVTLLLCLYGSFFFIF